jgi:hypothetical protein
VLCGENGVGADSRDQPLITTMPRFLSRLTWHLPCICPFTGNILCLLFLIKRQNASCFWRNFAFAKCRLAKTSRIGVAGSVIILPRCTKSGEGGSRNRSSSPYHDNGIRFQPAQKPHAGPSLIPSKAQPREGLTIRPGPPPMFPYVNIFMSMQAQSHGFKGEGFG